MNGAGEYDSIGLRLMDIIFTFQLIHQQQMIGKCPWFNNLSGTSYKKVNDISISSIDEDLLDVTIRV